MSNVSVADTATNSAEATAEVKTVKPGNVRMDRAGFIKGALAILPSDATAEQREYQESFANFSLEVLDPNGLKPSEAAKKFIPNDNTAVNTLVARANALATDIAAWSIFGALPVQRQRRSDEVIAAEKRESYITSKARHAIGAVGRGSLKTSQYEAYLAEVKIATAEYDKNPAECDKWLKNQKSAK